MKTRFDLHMDIIPLNDWNEVLRTFEHAFET